MFDFVAASLFLLGFFALGGFVLTVAYGYNHANSYTVRSMPLLPAPAGASVE